MASPGLNHIRARVPPRLQRPRASHDRPSSGSRTRGDARPSRLPLYIATAASVAWASRATIKLGRFPAGRQLLRLHPHRHPVHAVGTRILRADDRVRLARTSPESSGCGRPSTPSGPGAKRRCHQLRLPEWHWARPPPRPVYSQDGPPDSNTSAPGNSSANRPPGRCFTSEDITTEHRRQA